MKITKWCWIICISIAFFSCKRKIVTCCHTESYIRSVFIAFVGYDSTEVKTAVLRRFTYGSGFQQAIDSALYKGAFFVYSGDTAYDESPNFLIGPNYEYSLTLSDSIVYTFTSKPNEDVKVCVEMEEHCSLGSSQPVIYPLKEIKVNGQEVTPSPYPGDSFYPCIFLKK